MLNFDRFFKTDAEKVREAEEVLSLLSPDLQQRRLERDEHRVTKLRELLARRDELQRAREAEIPKIEDFVSAAQAKEKTAHEALKAATGERVNAEHARLSASCDFSLNMSQVEAEIRKITPKEVEEFIWEMRKLDDETRLELKHNHRPGPKGRITGQITSIIVSSNSKDIENKRALIKKAIAEAESMKLEPLSVDQIISRLEELKAAIPGKIYQFQTNDVRLPDVADLRR